ncbi:MAG: hypothetical protein C0518_01550 [Opitutus sp.]|nr:hypothetical protein [Opitutus sp.]
MRLFLFLLCGAVLLATGFPADEPELNPYDPLAGVHPPLAAALRKFGRDAGRWAYTQKFAQLDKEGKVKESWVARFDPSQHYDVQWTLMEEDGQPATERQLKKFRKQRAKLAKDRKTLGELLLVQQAVVAFESTNELVYEVPLKLEESSRFPPEKFQVFVTIDRRKEILKLVDVKLRENVRVAGVVNVKNADARLEFATVMPEHDPALVAMSGGGTASLLFITVGARAESLRTDFRRVTPYDERFNVKLGPLKAIDF